MPVQVGSKSKPDYHDLSVEEISQRAGSLAVESCCFPKSKTCCLQYASSRMDQPVSFTWIESAPRLRLRYMYRPKYTSTVLCPIGIVLESNIYSCAYRYNRLYCKITSPFNSTTKKLYRLSYSYACVLYAAHTANTFYHLQEEAERLYTMAAPHSSVHPGTRQPHPLSIQNMVHSVGDQGFSSCSNTMVQQYGLIPAASMYINPAVLQSVDVPLEKHLHPKPEMCQRVMTGQGQHSQEHQEPGPFMSAPIHEPEVPVSAPAWTRNTKHRRLKPGCAPAIFGQQRSRSCHGQLQMMSTWRFQDHQGNQPQGGLSTHSVKHRVTRALVSHRSGAPRSPGVQRINVETYCHGEWLQRPLVRRVPPALQRRLPSIRSLIPELPETFANQTEVSTGHQS
ncbi:hypothetical protein FOXG_22304 [Fusarium oxysporum f. sp. lycopersici 4287]|uniref:Uncharacterized protein n=1 Tax=Fusarium oxysporum f. sp. lycopersici (strain 4287 / CBS 123668 / FGSC 9935 / NRRL 34936) TaxID=426428 RepID=A0A0J9W726_FUSO4|nr:hypothetical protein FOXG_22304 [Fusarium oxysporum f. sp. lycopersici 4287]XP_018256658.1 hypothetical protein FOXG_22304 [Fusarium oxysporum f. sp. lycopersici 4287]KNB18612.1 hypothetical protein FOXG_22304 [Fusarium oxysporum f. sp. lycopersici 4287]KNB18613.1 hypothetical protein FOXG_22304 [Fusarium oxysporum f. sp. lycopersici 4287]